jgi:hypothetical protein
VEQKVWGDDSVRGFPAVMRESVLASLSWTRVWATPARTRATS